MSETQWNDISTENSHILANSVSETLTTDSRDSPSSLLVVMDSPTRMSNMKLILEDPSYHWKSEASQQAGRSAARVVQTFDTVSPLIPDGTIATLKWSDLQIGKLLGKGAFSKVYEVQVGRNHHKFQRTITQETTWNTTTETKTTSLPNRLDKDFGSPVRSRRCWESRLVPPSHPSEYESWDEMFSTYSEQLLENSQQQLLLQQQAFTKCAWNMESIVDVCVMEDAHDTSIDFTVDESPPCEQLPSFALKHLDISKINCQKAYIDAAIDIVMEARLLSCLQHENIIQLFAVTEGSIENAFSIDDRGYFLVLSLLHSTLESRIEEWTKAERATENERIPVALGIANGMRYLHQNLIVYRDLKPQNIGFSSDGIVKIYDLSLSKELPKSGQPPLTTRTGSLRYMAPEVALQIAYGLEVDVYSFAIVFWELCCLKKPFDGMTSSEHTTRVVKGHERPKISLISSNHVQQVLTKAWAPKPSDRPAFEQIVRLLEPLSMSPARGVSRITKSTPSGILSILMQTRKTFGRPKKASKKEGAGTPRRSFLSLQDPHRKVALSGIS